MSHVWYLLQYTYQSVHVYRLIAYHVMVLYGFGWFGVVFVWFCMVLYDFVWFCMMYWHCHS